ncbi:MAG: glycosyltransferase family 2 protein [Candidatus Omnitrophica bacterium]|nr:glycosyltransferase family 2 protein [Candidatus Omnitrophota bacterium]
MALLTVIVPVFNEAKTISQIIEKIQAVPLEKEIFVIDDGSTDETAQVLRLIRYDNLTVIHHPTNRDKGAAVLTGLSHAKGTWVIIQDADLEYNPDDYVRLIEAGDKGNADLVLGSRFTKGYQGACIPRLGNRLVTMLFNISFGVRLNDLLTCYKLIHRSTLPILQLQSKGFDIDIEVVAKMLRHKLRLSEVSVSYNPRSYAEGKKMRVKDGIGQIMTIVKYCFKLP